MRIAIVSPGFDYGGSYIVAANVGKALAKVHDVYYFAYQSKANFSNIPQARLEFFGHPQGGIKKQVQRVQKAGELLINHQFVPAKYHVADIQALLSLIDFHKIDLVVLNTYLSVTFFSSALKRARPDVPRVGWIHEASSFSFGTLTHNYRPSFEKGLSDLSQIVCLSQNDRQKYLTLNDHVKVMYNPVRLAEHSISNLKEHAIAFTTRLDFKIKGIDYLIQVANQLPDDWHIEFAGQGTPAQEKAFKEMLQKDAVEGRIIYHGALTGAALSAHYQHCSMFLSTSRTEGLPLVIIEAMSFGLPVISFAHSGGQEILQNDKYGILAPIGDVQAMVHAIKSVIASPERMLELQDASLKRYEDFRMETVLPQWLDLLSDVLAR